MSRFHAEFQRLGGPGAVTWWAFFVSLGDRLLTVSVQPLNMAAPAWARVVATVIAGIAMFIPLVILRFTLLKDPLRPRPWVALAGFAVAVVIRGLVADQMLHHLGGMPLMPALRVFSGFVSTMIPLIVTAYVVNTLRERRRDLAALLDVRERLERARTESEAAVQLSNESLVQRVRTVMEAELSALSGEQPSGVVSQLQRTATEVVRPLSHELATSFAKREGPEVVEPPAKVGWREVVRDASLDRPLNPALATLVLAGIWIAAALTLATIRWPLMASLAAVPLSLAGANAILRRVLPRLAPLGRIAAVGVACLASGVAVGLAMRVLLGSWSNATFTAIAGGFYVILVSAGLALVSGIVAARDTVLEETAMAVGELRNQVIRTRQLLWFHQRGLARALHGPVQSAVTAAALRLDDAARNDAISPSVVDAVRADLMRTLDVLSDSDASTTSLDDGIARIVGTWEGVCDVNAAIDERSSAVLDTDPVLRACVMDVLTDATSNAVRHGRAAHVTIALTCDAAALALAIQDDGSAPIQATRSGLGTTLLDDCALSWSLTQDDRGHRLQVLLPTPEGFTSLGGTSGGGN